MDMAVGDVVVDVQAVAGDGDLVFQPAATTEYMITNGCAEGDWWMGLTDGVAVTAKVFNYNAQGQNNLSKIFINNTTYLAVRNNRGAAGQTGYCGIQIQ